MKAPPIHLACEHCYQAKRFTRTRGSKALGCLAYALAIPVLSVFVGMGVLALAFAGAGALGASENLAVAVALGLGLLAAASIVAWGIRSYRREAAVEIVVEAGRLTITRGPRTTALDYADVVRTRIREGILGDPVFVATTRNGRTVSIPQDVAPLSDMLEALTLTIVAREANELERRLQAGEVLAVGLSRGRCVGHVATALIVYAMALFNGITLRFTRCARQALHANRLVRLAARGWPGGLVMSRDEIRGARLGSPAFAWEEAAARTDADGLIVYGEQRRRLALPTTADGFLPAMAVIKNRLNEVAATRDL